ncbi:MAG: ankyrin repeat domain-containing protein [Planctomycetota bacterium]
MRWTSSRPPALDEVAILVGLLRDEPTLVEARSPDGFTALHLAAFLGRDRAARVLLGHGADLEAVHPANGLRPLNSGAASRRAPMVRLLLAAGAEPDARQKGGFTALHSAARHGDLAMTEALLVHGADPSLAADDGQDALAFAREGGGEAVIRRLEASTRG